jgi:hypothetical protein
MSLMTFRNQIIRRGDFRDKVSVKDVKRPQNMLYLFLEFKWIVQICFNVNYVHYLQALMRTE